MNQPISDDINVEAHELNAGVAQSLYTLTPLTLVTGSLVGALLSAWLAWSTNNPAGWALIAWFLAIGGARWWLNSHYQANQNDGAEVDRSIGAAVVTATLTGIGWAALVFLFYPSDDLSLAVLISATVLSCVAIQIGMLSASLPAMLGIALPSAAALAFKWFGGGQAGYLTLGLVLAALTIGILYARTRRTDIRRIAELSNANLVLRDQAQQALNRNQEISSELETTSRDRELFSSQLKAAKGEAQAAAMAKDEFLATMSHEIRTPLNGIMPLLDLLRSTKLDDAQRDYLNTAFISSKHLLSIIDDILDYSKVEAGKLELEVVGMNLRELLDSVSRMMFGSANRKGLELKTQIDPNVRLAMRGDPVRLRQILTNLVSNAIKFTERGQIVISVSKQAESRAETELRFAVRDTGIGMDEEARNRLFKPFSQADASTTRNYGGTGLGLAICKRLVEMMDGQIGVDSEPNQGSEFWFTARLKKSMGDIGNDISRLDGKRLLLVTSNENYSRRLGVFAGRWGSTLQVAANVKEAVLHIKQAHQRGPGWAYEAMLIDVKNTGGQGLALAKKVSESKQLQAACLLLTEDGQIPKALASVSGIRAIQQDSAEAPLHERLEALVAFEEGDTEDQRQQADYEESGESDSMKAKILLVEDNPINLHVAQKLLDAIGLEFDVANNGKIGVEKMASGEFDAVLMDCMMPIMDGYTATKRWRSQEQETGASKRLPIIAMTANAMAGDRQLCLDAGMDDYMSKPLNRKLVVTTLRRWIGSGESSGDDSDAPQPAAMPSPDQVLNQDTLKDLAEVMEDELGDLIQVYLQDSPERVEGIRAAAAAREVKPMIELAHTLKSTSANLGASQLTEICRQIEESAKADEVKEAVAAAAPLGGAYERASKALQDFLDQL